MDRKESNYLNLDVIKGIDNANASCYTNEHFALDLAVNHRSANMKLALKSLIILIALQFFVGVLEAQMPPAPTSAAPATSTPAASAPVVSTPQTGLVPDASSPAPSAKPEEAAAKPSVLSLSPSIEITPLGVDKLDKYGPWIALEPVLEFKADLFSATQKKISFKAIYDFAYQQYLGQNYEKIFAHDIVVGISHSLTPRLSFTWNNEIKLLSFYLYERQSQNTNLFDAVPGLTYKLTDEMSVGIGYFFDFFYSPNSPRTYDSIDTITNPPTDASDIVRGGGGLYNYTIVGTTPTTGSEAQKNFTHAIKMNFNYKISPITSLGLTYYYYASVYSNNDAAEFTGHQGLLTIDQDLWKDGHFKLQYRLRRCSFLYAFAPVSENYRISYRHRFYLNLSQKISDYVSLEADYKLEQNRSNTTDVDNSHSFYIGVILSF